MAIEKATIHNLATGEVIPVGFNPEEYSLDSANSFAEVAIPGLRVPPLQFGRGSGRTLKMDLFFDASIDPHDVRTQTRRVVALLEKDRTLQAPPILLFSWGGFHLKCVLEHVGQRFTRFLPSGVPVRAYLSVTFKEFAEISFSAERGVFAGPPAIRNIIANQTIDQVAARELGNPGAWREIATRNKIDNPRKLDPSRPLVLPPRRRGTPEA